MRQLKSKITALFIFCAGLNGNCFAQYESQKLTLGIKTERLIEPLQKHSYSINLKKGAYANGYIDQIGVNLNVSVLSPNGKLVVNQDLEKCIDAPEPFAFETKIEGEYIIEVIPKVGHIIETEIDRNGFIWDGERRVPYETINQAGAYTIVLDSQLKEKSFEGSIDEIFEFYNNKKYPGAAVSVVKDGEIVFEKGYGLANAEYDLPISPSTVFHIASVSKQFAAFALTQLHDEGEISLDDNITKYIPELQISESITIRQMLNHTSGLRDQWILLALAGWRMDDVITQNQLLNIIFRQKELNFQPGEKYSYSNTNYTLAAEIVKRVTGKNLRQWTTENIFDPLSMNSTFFYNDHEELVKNRAYSYDDRSGKLKKSNLNFANMGATSLFTTVHDFSQWLVNFGEMKVGNKKVFELLTTKGVLNDGKESHYALGLVVRDYKGYTIYNHSGVDAGYRSYIMYFPDEKLGVVVLSNLASCNTIDLAKRTADLFLDIESKPRDADQKADEKKSPYEDIIEIDGEILPQYSGEYYSPELETRYSLYIQEGKLMVRHKRLEDIEFLPKDKDVFKGTYWVFDKVEFERDEEGLVTGFRVTNGGVVRQLFIKD